MEDEEQLYEESPAFLLLILEQDMHGYGLYKDYLNLFVSYGYSLAIEVKWNVLGLSSVGVYL